MTDHILEEKWKEQMENCETYVMCSTLNQIVNYLPLKQILEVQKKSGNDRKKLRIVNLTYARQTEESSKREAENIRGRFPNEEWDENFKNVVTEQLSGFSHKLVLDMDTQVRLDRRMDIEQLGYEIEKVISEESSAHSAVIWNLTGGQRNELLAIERFIERDTKNANMVLYLEGNTQRCTVGCCDDTQWKYKELKGVYEDRELTLETVLKLAGYEMTSKESYRFSDSFDADSEEEKRRKEYDKIFAYYRTHPEFCKKLIETNKAKNSWVAFEELLKSEFKQKDKDNSLPDKDVKDKKDIDTDIDIGIIKESVRGRGGYPFGYFLEYLTEAAVINYVKNKEVLYKSYFNSLVFDVSVSKGNRPKGSSGKISKQDQFCQLDMVLLLNSGQMVVFECKSGGMPANDAKAREYTAFALGGVYGKPVLVTPMLKSDIENDKCKSNKETEDGIYKNIVSACRAAERAGLDICYLDELENSIESIFNEIMMTYGGEKQ